MISAGSLLGRNVDFVGDAGAAVGDGGSFGGNDLGGLILRKMSKRTEMVGGRKIRESADVVRITIAVDAGGVVAKTVFGSAGPETGGVDSAAGITISIGNRGGVLVDERVGGDGKNFVAPTGRGGDGGNV